MNNNLKNQRNKLKGSPKFNNSNEEDLILKKEYFQLKVISLGVKDLIKCIRLDEIVFNSLWTESQWKKELSDPKRLCLGIFLKSHLIAFSCGLIILDELQITTIAVHPRQQKKGLGKIILSTLIKKAKISGAKRVLLEVKESNESAKNLYKKCGFEITGSRKKYYRDGSDAILFCKDLN